MARIRPATFVHVVDRTRRFEEMISWYRTVFDAKVQHQDPVLAFLTYDDEHHRFAFANLAVVDPDGKETDRRGMVGVDHVAYAYPSLRDLFENYAQLRSSASRRTGASTTAENPIGVEDDPETWLARLHAGEAPESLLPRTVHQPVSPIRGAAAA